MKVDIPLNKQNKPEHFLGVLVQAEPNFSFNYRPSKFYVAISEHCESYQF